MSFQSPNLATLGLEQLKKTAGTSILPILEVIECQTCITSFKALEKFWKNVWQMKGFSFYHSAFLPAQTNFSRSNKPPRMPSNST